MKAIGLLSAVLLLSGGAAGAQSITVSGTQTIAAVTTATAGSQPNAVTTTAGSTTYNVTTGNVSQAIWRIRARLSVSLGTGRTLAVQLIPVTGAGTSSGWVTLSTTDQAVVTGIPNNRTYNSNGIQYRLTVTVAAGIVTSTTCTNCVIFSVVQP